MAADNCIGFKNTTTKCWSPLWVMMVIAFSFFLSASAKAQNATFKKVPEATAEKLTKGLVIDSITIIGNKVTKRTNN